MPRDTAIKQLNALKVQFDEDIKIAGELGSKMSKQMTEFQDANNKILDSNPSARTILYVEKTSPTPEETKQVAPEIVKSTKKKNRNNKKTSTPSSSTVASKPQTSVVTKPTTSAAVEVAHVTETNQIKQKAFSDQVSQAKAQAKVAFSLEGSVSLITPETLLCGL
jgi:hypothetical protein